MAVLEFYFDCSSPWTYLAFTRVHDIAARAGATIVWKPILVGGVFNAVNRGLYERRANPEPRQSVYSKKDMQDWARLAGVKIKWLPSVFPVNSVNAMRGAYHALGENRLVPYARAVFEAYWGDDLDISDPAVLRVCAEQAGLNGDKYLAAIAAPEAKAQLRAATDELIARGAFGSPTMFIGDDMYFGNDRLPLVEAGADAGIGVSREGRDLPTGEPLFLVPWSVPAFAGVFVLIHLALQLAPVEWKSAAYFYGQLVPARFLAPDQWFVAVSFADLLLHGFLHYDWVHLGVNVIMLLAAAGPVMRNCGVVRTWLLFLACVLAGGLLHVAVYWGTGNGVIGASGGASGIIAAALRYRARRLSLGEIVAPINRPPVSSFAIFWICINLLLFVWDLVGGGALSGLATMAHIGGCVAGLLLAPFFVRGARPSPWPRST